MKKGKPNKAKALLNAMFARKEPNYTDADYLSTGSTILNLACSGKYHGGLRKGTFTYFVGDSSSGKTWFTRACFAETRLNPNFAHYRLIEDNPENGALMEYSKFFPNIVGEVEEPSKSGCSRSLEEFYYNLDDALNRKEPFIYILDSMDAVRPQAAYKQFVKEKRKARGEIKENITGSYGTDKARMNSQNLPDMVGRLPETGSILLMISQTRDNIGAMAMFNPKTRSGGKVLKFGAHYEMWTSVREDLKTAKEIRGQKWKTGILARVKVEKNRITGRELEVEVPILWSTGIDDLGNCVDFLVKYQEWEEKQKVIHVPEWGISKKREALVAWVEETGLEDDLRQKVAEVWEEIQREISVRRKPRY